jgi:hypothetical protein
MAKLSRGLLLAFIVSVFSAPVVFAEEVTIATYYPSPYGSYNELQLYPHSTPVATCNATNKGTMYYDSDDSQIKVCDGASWTSAALGVSYTYYCFTNSALGSPVCADAGGTQQYCPAGYTQKLALGQWGGCLTPTSNSFLLPPGGSCGATYPSTVVGSAYVCSQ